MTFLYNKKLHLIISLFLLISINASAQVTTVWEKSAATASRPLWFGADTERGLAYGNVGGNDRLYAVSRSGYSKVLILNAATGDSIGVLDTAGIVTGTYLLNDVGVSADGIIFAANMTTSGSTVAFKVYKWINEAAAPVNVINYTASAAIRLGDKITVVGSASDNSLKIFVPVATSTKNLIFSTTDNGTTFTVQEVTMNFANSSTPSLAPVNLGTDGYYIKSNGRGLRKIDASNNVYGGIDSNVIPTGGNALRYFTSGARKFLVVFTYGNSVLTTNSTGFNERARIFEFTSNDTTGYIVGNTPMLGTNTNSNGTGDVDIKDNGNGTFTIFVMSTNQGLGAYTFDPAGATGIVTAPYTQDFAEYFTPPNWTRYTGYLLPSTMLSFTTLGFLPDDFGNVTTTGDRSARLNIYGTTRNHWLITPTIDLGSGTTSYKLEFDLALTKYSATTWDSLGVDDTLAVVISTDNGITWSSDNTLKVWKFPDSIATTAQLISIPLDAYTGLVKLGFYGASSISNEDNDLFIDSVMIKEYVPPQVDWCNLQWPPTISMTQGDTAVAYAQAWISGVTDSAGQAFGLNSWIGISSTNTDPATWTTWVEAPFNVQAGNNDEFWAHFGYNLTPGTYYYASRFQYLGGPYRYGGTGGFWNGTTSISGVLTVNAPVLIATNWLRSAGNGNLPTWFSSSGSTERGLGFGYVNNGTDAIVGAVFVVTRNGGLFVKVLNDSTGADIVDLNTTGTSGGTYVLNDIGVTEDGKILSSNLTTNASTSPFKVYMWDNLTSVPVTAISYTGTEAVRLGDKITITGNYSNGTAAVWAASATTGIHKVYKFTMSGGVFNQVPEVIACSDNLTTGIGSASVGPLPNGDFYWNSGGQSARKYMANGTLIGVIPGSVIATGSNAIRYLGKIDSVEYIVTFQHGAGNENARVVGVPESGVTNAFTYGITPPLGTNSNANGTGDVAFRLKQDQTADIFVLSTNNGVGSYKTLTPVPVELNSFAASVSERSVILKWSTATESNTSLFRVEKTIAGNEYWSPVGDISAAGSSTEKKDYSFTDNNLSSGKYLYRLKMIDLDGSYEYSNTVEVEIGVPAEFALSQNYPNPFNPSTKINYQLPVDASVTIELFDITGQKIATLVDQDMKAGYHSLELSGAKLSSGMYIYRINAVSTQSGKNFMDVKKMMMLK